MRGLDGRTVRERLAGKRGRAYWRSLEELAGDPAFAEFLHREWPRQAALWDRAIDRRSVLRLMGASLALAGLAACDGHSDEDIVPYVEQPGNVDPGIAKDYATALTLDGYAHGVLGETHTGRPTGIRGNPEHPVSRGACSAFDIAAVLGLYDPDRSQAVRQSGEIASYDAFLAAVTARRATWREGGGEGLRILSGRISSPTLLDAIARLRGAFPGLRWYRHDAVDRGGVEDGARLAFGAVVEPIYRFAEARVVLSLDSDFLGAEEPGHLAYAREFMSGRRPEDARRPPTRLYVVESTPGLAGAVADHVLRVPPSRIAAIARALAARLGLAAAGRIELAAAEARWVDAAADDLERNRGRAPVTAGLAQPPLVHALAHAMNERLGNAGATVGHIPRTAPAADGSLRDLVTELEQGRVDTLLILDGNPVYSAPADLAFPDKLARAGLVIHWGLYADETARRAHWHLPAAHELESWGDARAFDGTVSLQQPLIAPLHGGRTAGEVIAALASDERTSARDLVRAFWRGVPADRPFEQFWRLSLRKGVVDGTTATPGRVPLRADFDDAIAKALQAGDRVPRSAPSGEAIELRFRPDPSAWDGRFANNGWLQELPRPLSKIVWDNAAMVGPAMAERLGLERDGMVRIEAGGRAIEAPVWVLPGQPDGCITLPLGYGRRRAGRIGSGIGFDAYRLRASERLWIVPDARVRALDRRHHLVTTQHHHAMEGRRLVRRATWEAFRSDPEFAHEHGKAPTRSLYPEPDPRGRVPGQDGWTPYDWGMVIDFDLCIGCRACVIACQAENNIPIVGAKEADRGRAMHWLRIDRYYAGDPQSPSTVFQPVPCMHCENAPCEYVCPVEATQHSSEGLNEMIYNRCIGTRYCSQNCPYKVRRFNWFDFTGRGAAFPAIPALQNPEVTVRSRGVMEKCTYCVQRIDQARIRADREGRTIAAGEVTTACQDACPTRAIVFGNINDGAAEVSTLKASPRNYGMLEELNTRPRTTYLAGVRDPNPALATAYGEEDDVPAG